MRKLLLPLLLLVAQLGFAHYDKSSISVVMKYFRSSFTKEKVLNFIKDYKE